MFELHMKWYDWACRNPPGQIQKSSRRDERDLYRTSGDGIRGFSLNEERLMEARSQEGEEKVYLIGWVFLLKPWLVCAPKHP